MEDYKIFEKKVKTNQKRNEKFIEEFENYLIEKGLGDKTINKHINNASLYIDDYLNYYDAETMEEGIHSVDGFLSDWFIRKCLWSSRNSLKETAASIKKFYECMSEKNHVSEEDYKSLCKEIKENMNRYLEEMSNYEDEEYLDLY